MDEANHDHDKELALPLVNLIFGVMAITFGLAGNPIGTLGAGLAAQATDFAQAFMGRKQARRLHRLHELCKVLDFRLRHVEAKTDDQKVDLFLEVCRKAVMDDEERKLPFYVAVLEWIAKKSPTAAQVRVLSDGVQQLSYVELFAFLVECAGRRPPRDMLKTDGITFEL